MSFHYIPIPRDIATPFLTRGSRRVIATINGHVLDRGLQGGTTGDPYIVVGLSILRQFGVAENDVVIVELEPHPDPSAVDLGEEFAEALAQDPEASARFFALSPGAQRGLASYVTGAKRVETRVKRAIELARKLRTYTLYGDLNPPSRDN